MFTAQHLATAAKTFSGLHIHHIETLAQDLTRRLGAPVVAEYGDTDTGDQWAALCIEELPEGADATPGPLVSILAGAGTQGGHIVMDADGQCVGSRAGSLDYARVMPKAQKEAQAAYRCMCVGAWVN
ncbi:hypothetical protein [Rhodoferax sp.]|uniref:hypothetical protein n=1 Tax=Rhodoferax sp. TaxID=50421 RepID=UPI003267816C